MATSPARGTRFGCGRRPVRSTSPGNVVLSSRGRSLPGRCRHIRRRDIGVMVGVINLEIVRAQVSRPLRTPMETGKAADAAVAPDRPIVCDTDIAHRADPGAGSASDTRIVGMVAEPVFALAEPHTNVPEQSRQHLPRFVAEKAKDHRVVVDGRGPAALDRSNDIVLPRTPRVQERLAYIR